MVLQIRNNKVVAVRGVAESFETIANYAAYLALVHRAQRAGEAVMGGSDMDFPEEATNDPEVIKLAQQIVGPKCPGCSGPGVLSDDPQVMRCEMCGGVFTTDQPISEQQVRQFVAFGQAMLQNAGPDGSFYFDFMVVPSFREPGLATRVHGWADKATKRVVQWG
jgi:hypothetical protein